MGKKKAKEPYRPVGDRLNRNLVASVVHQEADKGTEPPAPEQVPQETVLQSASAKRAQATPAPKQRGRKVRGPRAKLMLEKEKRILLTKKEEYEFDELITQLAREMETKLKASHVLRACITLLHHADADILRAIRDVGVRSRPANGDVVGLAEFEDQVAEVISNGLRAAEAFRSS